MKLIYSLIPLVAIGCAIGWCFTAAVLLWGALLSLTQAAQELEQGRP